MLLVGHPVIHVLSSQQLLPSGSWQCWRDSHLRRCFHPMELLLTSGMQGKHTAQLGPCSSGSHRIPILCEFQVSTARRSLLRTHKRERNPSTEINFWYRKMCVDVHENRKENKAHPIFRSSKDTILVKNWCKTEDMNLLLSLQLVPTISAWLFCAAEQNCIFRWIFLESF